ncbi:hypothetical protein CRUP_006617, partial [Coryphaenoides rupestris]
AIDPGQAEGLGPLVELMGRCWHSVPRERPSFLECVSVTGRLYGIHKCGINDAVHHFCSGIHGWIRDGRRYLPTARPGDGWSFNNGEPRLGQWHSFSETQRSRPSTYTVPASSVIPNHAPVSDPPPVVTETMHSHGEDEPAKAQFTPYQRQISNSEALQHQHHPRKQQQHAVLCISNISSITGFLIRTLNSFSMRTVKVPGDRHPTAPPSFNTREGPQSGSRQGAMGKLGVLLRGENKWVWTERDGSAARSSLGFPHHANHPSATSTTTETGKTRKPEKVEYFQPPIRLPLSSLREVLSPRSISTRPALVAASRVTSWSPAKAERTGQPFRTRLTWEGESMI